MSLEATSAEDPVAAFARLEAKASEGKPSRGQAFVNPAALPDYSPRGFLARVAACRALLQELGAIDRASLPHKSQITYDAIQWDAERVLDREPYVWLQFPYTPYEFVFGGPNRILSDYSFTSDADADAS